MHNVCFLCRTCTRAGTISRVVALVPLRPVAPPSCTYQRAETSQQFRLTTLHLASQHWHHTTWETSRSCAISLGCASEAVLVCGCPWMQAAVYSWRCQVWLVASHSHVDRPENPVSAPCPQHCTQLSSGRKRQLTSSFPSVWRANERNGNLKKCFPRDKEAQAACAAGNHCALGRAAPGGRSLLLPAPAQGSICSAESLGWRSKSHPSNFSHFLQSSVAPLFPLWFTVINVSPIKPKGRNHECVCERQ